MKIVPSVGAFDYHHEEVPPVIKVTVTYRRFELFAVLLYPVF
jgi:hypothetical protein